ncbi:hypothetical protein BH10BDE1_BH10BDE1_03880 [soil metagenome]
MMKKSFGFSVWMLALCGMIATVACSGPARRSSDGSLDAPAPDDSPAVVTARKTGAVAPRFSVADPAKWSSSETSKTGVIFAWTISGSTRLVSDSGCRLRVRNRESGDTVLLKIEAQTPVSVQSLKPGTWDAKRLGCGLTRIWDLEGLFRDGFVVKPGSISVIGWFVFEFDERTLVTVREGGRQENTNLAMQLRGGWSGNSTLISGFSGKLIPMKLEPRDEIVRVKATGLPNSDSVLQPLLSRFQTCASSGMKVDPLRAGTLKMEATYKAGKFVGAKTVAQENALRDDLIQCILEAHEKFNVAGGGDFSLETTY